MNVVDQMRLLGHHPNPSSGSERSSLHPGQIPLEDRLAMLAFIVIFPGHIFYQVMVHADLFPPVLGGYFTASALAMFPMVLFALIYARYLRIGMGTLLFVGFMMFFCISIIFGIQAGIDHEITAPHTAFVFKFTCFYLLAAIAPWERRKFQQVCRLFVVLLAGVIFLNVQYFGAAFATEVDIESGMQMDYQGMGFAYVVVSLGALHKARWKARLGIYLLSVSVLFFIGARAEFIAFLVISTVVEYFLAKSKTLFLLQMIGVLLLATTTAFLTPTITQDSRMFNLLDADADQSLIERRELHADALRTIQKHPLMGSYGSYAPGGYAHNVLSAWVDLGLPGFLLLNIMFFAALLDMCSRRKRRDWNDSLAFSFAMLVATYFLLMFAKSYTYQMIPVALGAYLHMQSRLPRLRGSKAPR